MARRRLPPALVTLALLYAVLRAALGLALAPHLGPMALSNSADLQTRLHTHQWLEDPAARLPSRAFPWEALLAQVQRFTSDLILGPALFGQLGLLLVLLGIVGVSLELFPRQPGAALFAVILISPSPGLLVASYSALPMVFAAGLICGAWWALLRWRRTREPVLGLLAGLALGLANLVSFDSWLLTLPLLLATVLALARRRIPLPVWRLSSWLLPILGFAPLAWSLGVGATSGLGLGEWLVRQFGPTAPGPFPLSRSLAALLVGLPLLLVALPMTLVGNLSRENRDPLPVARLQWLSLLLMLVSVALKTRSPLGHQRLLLAVLPLVPLAAAGTWAAVAQASDAPRRLQGFLVVLAIGNLLSGAFQAGSMRSPHEDALDIGRMTRHLVQSGLLGEGQRVLLEDEPRDEIFDSSARRATADLAFAVAYAPDSCTLGPVLPGSDLSVRARPGPAGAQDDRAKFLEHLEAQGAVLAVVTGRSSMRALSLCRWREAGTCGRYQLFAAPDQPELGERAEQFIRDHGTPAAAAER